MTDGGDRERFVRQYVERQKAYLPTYTAAYLENERHGTPPKSLRSDGFGFDTPVLRSRVPADPSEKLQAGPRPPQASTTKDKQKHKRKKTSTPSEGDAEHAARLADRRERKRRKRAIVNPPQKRDDATPHKGRTTGQKVKKPAALALLYGFSATNVTKDRLTVKPAPSLGVFSKGKASAKKKVTTNKSSSRNEFFSECAFLNKPSDGQSKRDDGSDDSSVSKPHVAKYTKRDRGKLAPTSTRTPVESEIWDIEVQSKLPSSARDVSSEVGEEASAPVVLDLREAEWSASVDAADEGHEGYRKETLSRSLSATQRGSRGHAVVRSSPQARSNVRDAHAVDRDAPSIHPSHSASQVGRRADDTQRADLRSRYFTEAEIVSTQESIANFCRRSRSNDPGTASDDGVEEAALDVRTASRTTDSPTSVGRMAVFQSGYDMVAPLVFPSDCSTFEGAQEGEPHEEYFELECGCTQDVGGAESETRWSWWQSAGDLVGDDVEEVSGWYDPLEPGLEDEYDEEDIEEDMGEFLEGRGLLLGVSEWPRCVGLSGLAQAEMDVARGLRDHWRPMRLW